MEKVRKQSFFYSIVDSDTHTWESGGTPTENMIGIAVEVPSGETREVPTHTDYGAYFELYGLTLKAYWWDTVNGHYWTVEPDAGVDTTWANENQVIATPLVDSLRIKLTQLSPSQHYIIGSQNRSELWNGDNHQLNPGAVQGDLSRPKPFTMGPHQIEPGGLLSLSIENTHATKNLIVSGMYHGKKVWGIK